MIWNFTNIDCVWRMILFICIKQLFNRRFLVKKRARGQFGLLVNLIKNLKETKIHLINGSYKSFNFNPKLKIDNNFVY